MQDLPRDINHVIITGEVTATPRKVLLKSGKPICLFLVRNLEKYRLASGAQAFHENYLSVEVFGKNVDHTLRDVRAGGRYIISGYLRTDEIDGVEKTRIRAFNIQEE